MNPTGLIYCASNKTNGMKYVGQTSRGFLKRRAQHEKAKDGSLFHDDLSAMPFDWTVLEDGIALEDLDSREVFWIKEMNSLAPNGYNRTPGGKDVGFWAPKRGYRFIPFYSWLKYKRADESPIGDLARDTFRTCFDGDPAVPKSSRGFRTWKAFLESHGACQGAIDALHDAYVWYRMDMEEYKESRLDYRKVNQLPSKEEILRVSW